MSAEFGEYDGNSNFESMAVNYFDQHMMGWTAWSSYNTGGTLASKTGYPQLVSDYIGTPLANMGTYIYQQLLNYAGVTGGGTPSPTPTLPPVTGPVSKVWYFAEGRVGAGFSEFLTLGNPTGNTCQVNLTYLTQPDSGTGGTKTFSFSVPASTRVTRWVDSDLGTSTTGHGISDAATMNVDTTTTPNCSGIVAERPMYFTALGTKSGSDVVGVTHTSTIFYFADMAVGSQPGGGTDRRSAYPQSWHYRCQRHSHLLCWWQASRHPDADRGGRQSRYHLPFAGSAQLASPRLGGADLQPAGGERATHLLQ